MEQLLEIIQSNVQMAPFIIFGALLLAGFNIPVSEDAMLFISAILAANNPELMPQLFTAVFAGAYLSDLICYGLGRYLGPKLWNIKFFANMVSKDKVKTMTSFYEKYGPLTLILGRFIPFGVRNGLFLTAGLGKMNFVKFALSDLLAATISCTTFFTLYYKYGKSVIEVIKRGNMVIFGIAIIIVVGFIIKKQMAKKKI